jgi:hypothetical protein
LLSLLVAAGTAAAPALAQVSISINIAPPPPQYEVVPALPPGYVWAPGYWAWHGNQHVWVHGRSIVQRPGYRWEPDRWEQRDHGYYRQPGRWERDADYKVAKAKHEKQPKHMDKGGDHAKHGKGGKHDD